MRQDRFLVGILIGIAILIVVALAIFFIRRDQATYISEATPDGVVHNYVLAILNRDYQKAYSYLADLDHKPDIAEFKQAFTTGRLSPSTDGIKVGQVVVTGDTATVQISIVYTPGDPFGSDGSNNVGSAQLVQQNGAWKISAMPTYNLWDFIWYQAPPKYP
jgi:hypothetical protein